MQKPVHPKPKKFAHYLVAIAELVEKVQMANPSDFDTIKNQQPIGHKKLLNSQN